MAKKKVAREVERVFKEFMKERNFVPYYAKILAKDYPEFLVNWFDTRKSFRQKGVLSPKVQELLLLAGNAARMNEVGVEMHTQILLEMGAKKQEILEAALCVWLIGGMPSLNVCLRSLNKLLEEKKPAVAQR